MPNLARLAVVAALLTAAACSTQPAQQPTAQEPAAQPAAPPDTRAEDEAAIREAVKQWAAAAQAKDAEKFASFYADGATLMMEDAPDVSGKPALREAVGGMMQDPNFALSFEANTVVVARSGDLAYETGTYTMTMSDARKKPATEKGHYVVVWQKQADGAWKVMLDVPVSDPPEAVAK